MYHFETKYLSLLIFAVSLVGCGSGAGVATSTAPSEIDGALTVPTGGGGGGGISTPPLNLEVNSLNGANGFSLNGLRSNDNAGASFARLPDFNGDGRADIAIGADQGELNGEQIATDRGMIYVLFGRSSFSAQLNLDTSTFNGTAGFILRGAFALDHAGYSLSSGDFNGDGLSDLLVGAYGSAGNRGRVYVIYGHSGAQPALVNLNDVGATQAGYQIIGPILNFPEQIGRSVAGLGDIDGDGFDDFAIGTPTSDLNDNINDNHGRVYVVYGKATQTNQTLDATFLNSTNGFVLQGVTLGGEVGYSIEPLGDLNQDGHDDFAVGAPKLAKAFVVFGKNRASFAAVNSLNATFLNAIAGFIISHSNNQTQTGYAISSGGDINNDGKLDILIGTPDTTAMSNGNAFLIFGRSTWPASITLSNAGVNGGNNPTVEGIRINPLQLNDDLGTSVSSIGDFNSDGITDLLVGAPRNDDLLGLFESTSDYGQAYVIFGHSGNWSNTTFATPLLPSEGLTIKGSILGGLLGHSSKAIGDLNGDGGLDFILSAPGANSNAGVCYVIYGTP